MNHKERIYKIITDTWQWLKKYSDLTQKDDWDGANEELLKIHKENLDSNMYERFTRSITCAAWSLVTEIAKENTK